MKRCDSIIELRSILKPLRRAGKRIGFVPTMGALHAGHLSLAHTLKEHCDLRVCSVFVNPTQFNDPKDYQAYLINIDRDAELLEKEGVDLLFAPSVAEIYAGGYQTTVSVNEISKPFEGALRAGHFTGVASVVTILFNAVQPDVAIFGEKDFQQLSLIERMVGDLKMDIEIVRGALVRDSDGLALSSRNARLSPEGRRQALAISRGLFAAQHSFSAGERCARTLEGIVTNEIINSMPNPEIDYVSLVNELSLEPLETVNGRCRILVVARVEGVRLLDNAPFHMG
ncbi:MAG: pantoate--beta-alanine ligase [Proteobacteria bacterium]|nr:pantoate--beta-alanine ligase [Pseudomonadota bacterium]